MRQTEPNLFTYVPGPIGEVSVASLAQSINIALTDEHSHAIDEGRMDVFLRGENTVIVLVWDGDEPDERAAVYTITVEGTN